MRPQQEFNDKIPETIDFVIKSLDLDKLAQVKNTRDTTVRELRKYGFTMIRSGKGYEVWYKHFTEDLLRVVCLFCGVGCHSIVSVEKDAERRIVIGEVETYDELILSIQEED